METNLLQIVYQDDLLIAINKPHGLLVHRSSIANDASVYALQLLRDQCGQRVYPIHRLDRKTSGVLLFAFQPEIVKVVQQQFEGHRIQKKYLAICRGYFPDQIEVDYALTNDKGKSQTAITFFKTVQRTELEIPQGKHQTSRYSLVEAFPKTGRMHQIRKHCNHLRHPIIGDRPHGCNKQNRLFKERWDMTTMLLHAAELNLQHPESKQSLSIKADPYPEFARMKDVLGL